MPADQLHRAVEASLPQRPNDVDGVGALRRNVEEQEIGRIAPAGVEHLARGAQSVRIASVARDGEREHASNGRMVVRDDACARRVLVNAQGDDVARPRPTGAASTLVTAPRACRVRSRHVSHDSWALWARVQPYVENRTYFFIPLKKAVQMVN